METTTKTISRGTLGLRFMQNALRAKQLKEVELEKAEVKDDGQWEIDQRIRDAWGPAPSSSSSQTISHESSYLPFIFSEASGSLSEVDIQRPKGRRVFNKYGVEETLQEKEPEPTPASTTAPDQKRLKVHPRPKSISAGSVGLFGFPDQAPSKPQNAKTAKQLIHDNTGVGEDLRMRPFKQLPNLSSKSDSAPASLPKPVFLKPAGVDDPHETRITSANSDIIHGARSKKKFKRERPSVEHPEGEEDIKPKKRKKKVQKSTT